MRQIFCGNLEYSARKSDVERLFTIYGKVRWIDMKYGYAFVYMEDERDAEDAIHALDGTEFGRTRRRLSVEWVKGERRSSNTLAVLNIPYHTIESDLKRHFGRHGKILDIRLKSNFAFIKFETQEDAATALDATNKSKLSNRVITVEFAYKDDNERRNGRTDGSHNRSPRRGYDRVRSRSPYRRERDSPDYGLGGGHNPSTYRRERASPDYRLGCQQSPTMKERGSPYRKERDLRHDQKLSLSSKEEREADRHHRRSPSPQTKWSSGDISYDLYPDERANPDRSHNRSPRRGYDRVRSGSPYRRDSPDYGLGGGHNPSTYPTRKERGSPYRKERDHKHDHKLSLSPKENKETDCHQKCRPSPQTKWSSGDISNDLNPDKKTNPEHSHRPSLTPEREEGEAED